MRFRISTDAMTEKDLVGMLESGLARSGYRITLGRARLEAPLSANLDICAAGNLTLSSVTTNLTDVARTRSNVAADEEEWFVVYRVRDAPQHYDFGRIDTILRPGDVGIGARNETFEATCRAGFAFDQLLAPASAVRPLLAGADAPRFLASGEPMAEVIGSAMSAAMRSFGSLSEPLAEGVLRNIVALASLAAGASDEGREAGREAMRAQKLGAARGLIERRLPDPDLSPATIADALRISPRTLHALFEPTGESFSRYVLRRRLARCHDALTAPGASGLTIADLAFACGFNSLATFNRAFLIHFGRSPSDVRSGR